MRGDQSIVHNNSQGLPEGSLKPYIYLGANITYFRPSSREEGASSGGEVEVEAGGAVGLADSSSSSSPSSSTGGLGDDYQQVGGTRREKR